MRTPEHFADTYFDALDGLGYTIPAHHKKALTHYFKQAQQEARQAQHAKTWAMRGEADAEKLSNMMERDTWTGYAAETIDGSENPATLDKEPCKFYFVNTIRQTLTTIRALPCPPLEMGE